MIRSTSEVNTMSTSFTCIRIFTVFPYSDMYTNHIYLGPDCTMHILESIVYKCGRGTQKKKSLQKVEKVLIGCKEMLNEKVTTCIFNEVVIQAGRLERCH